MVCWWLLSCGEMLQRSQCAIIWLLPGCHCACFRFHSGLRSLVQQKRNSYGKRDEAVSTDWLKDATQQAARLMHVGVLQGMVLGWDDTHDTGSSLWPGHVMDGHQDCTACSIAL